MSAADAAVRAARPRTLVSLGALYRLVLRTQISIPRLLGIGALGGLAIVIGLLASQDANAPLATLWLGASALGDLVEDRLLVYLSLKPVPRWQLPAAAVLATVTVVTPLTALPLTVCALVAGAGDVASAALLASVLAAFAYAGLFVAAGLWFRRAVWWGLAFIVIWENVVAYTAEGAARFTVIGWASSVLGLAEGIDVQLEAGSAAVAFVVLPAIALAGWLVATWRYRRADID